MRPGTKEVEWKGQDTRDTPSLLVYCQRAGAPISPVPNTWRMKGTPQLSLNEEIN